MNPRFPLAAADVTAAWIAGATDLPVVEVTADRVGTGLVGMNLRVALDYGRPRRADEPASLVLKLPSPDETSRATGRALRNYEREVLFYRHIKPTVGIRTPHCWHADWDETSGDFVLVLEDLAPAVQGDQVTGCDVAAADLALQELAKLHAPRWGDPTLADVDWLSHRNAEGAQMTQLLYQGVWDRFLGTYRHRLTASQVRLGERLGAGLAGWMEGNVPSALCVTHGDYRLDNLLFGTSEGGYPVAAVDWQTPGHGPGLADASYFLGAGLLPTDRRAHERQLLASYHASLLEGGVAQVSFDDCWEAYRCYAFAGCVMAVVASMIVGESERSQAMFGAMAERHFTHAEDLGAEAFLPA